MAIDLNQFKKIDFKNFYMWPLFGRIIIIGIVCIFVFILGYYFDFSGFSAQIYKRYEHERDLKQQIQSILSKQVKMKEAVSQLPEFQKLLNQWQDQLIKHSTLPDLLNQILKMGTTNKLKFSLFVPGDEKKLSTPKPKAEKEQTSGDEKKTATGTTATTTAPAGGDTKATAEANAEKKEETSDYFQVLIKTVIEGDYKQVGNFMSQVANMPLIVVIGDFVIAKGGNASQGAPPLAGNQDRKNRGLTTELTLEVYYLAYKK